MRNMMFATVCPHYHPKKGEPTWFVEKICAGLADKGILVGDPFWKGLDCDFHKYYNGVPKWHTIRVGSRWQVGDYFKPLIWSGKPYRSKTIQIASPIMVEKAWKIKFDECGVISINGFYDYSEIVAADSFMEVLARNDGLSEEDLHFWFPLGKSFEGQIICWNKNIEY